MRQIYCKAVLFDLDGRPDRLHSRRRPGMASLGPGTWLRSRRSSFAGTRTAQPDYGTGILAQRRPRRREPRDRTERNGRSEGAAILPGSSRLLSESPPDRRTIDIKVMASLIPSPTRKARPFRGTRPRTASWRKMGRHPRRQGGRFHPHCHSHHGQGSRTPRRRRIGC